MANWSYLGANPLNDMGVTPEGMSRAAAGVKELPAVKTAPTTMLGRMGAELPTMGKFVRGADGVLRAVGGFGMAAGKAFAPFVPWVQGAAAVGGEALGVMDKAADPGATGMDVATRTAEGVGRLGAMGAGAGLGAVAGGPIGAALGGAAGYFAPNAVYAARDWMRGDSGAPTAAPKTAQAPAGPIGPAVSDYGRLYDSAQADEAGKSAGIGAVPPVSAPPTNAPITPWTAADVRGTRIPERGTGAIQMGNGPVRTIDTRPTPAGPGAVAPQVADGSVGSYVGALMNQRQAGLTEARAAAKYKVDAEVAMKGPGAVHSIAQANRENFQVGAAQEHLRLNPGDYAGAAAVAAGRTQPAEYHYPEAGIPVAGDKNQTLIRTGRSGTAERIPIRTQVRGFQGSDGNYYRRDAEGKDVKMTDAEKAQFLAQQKRGPGAVQ